MHCLYATHIHLSVHLCRVFISVVTYLVYQVSFGLGVQVELAMTFDYRQRMCINAVRSCLMNVVLYWPRSQAVRVN